MCRYYITAEYRSTCIKHLKLLTDTDNSSGKLHADLCTSRIEKDEKDVKSIMELLEETWTNPFDPNPTELLCLSTGAKASPEVANHLLTAKKKGEAAYLEFQSLQIEKGEKKLL